jgi:1-pyrroline-5-carboxylate dehydrogenase
MILAKTPDLKLMKEEIFGPVLTVFVYPDAELDRAIEICDTGSPYALTGAVFAQDRGAIVKVANALRHAAGNFYINDKPTGAVVGQQPFGGGRASGTNDKAGSYLNLVRWCSPRSVKETFDPPKDYPTRIWRRSRGRRSRGPRTSRPSRRRFRREAAREKEQGQCHAALPPFRFAL